MNDYIIDIRSGKYSLEESVKIILEYNGFDNYPINAAKLAQKLGFNLFEGTFHNDSVTGLMVTGKEVRKIIGNQDNVTKVIIVNRDANNKQKNFTVAHELGHYFLHFRNEDDFFEEYHISKDKKEISNKDDYLAIKAREDEADRFAAALLMPSKVFIEYYCRYKNLDFDLLKEYLASIFAVEKEAVRRRISELGLGEM